MNSDSCDTRARKYPVPAFIGSSIAHRYADWLSRKVRPHVKRDRLRGNVTATREGYMMALHVAVVRSNGYDEYTGELLRWDLLRSYDNAKSKDGRRTYKAGFELLPTVDHVGDGTGSVEFNICAWRTNQAKADLTRDEFVELCQRVLDFKSRREGTK